jgi:hypothetical protein
VRRWFYLNCGKMHAGQRLPSLNGAWHESSMADRSKDTWYVSFGPRKLPGKRGHYRATERFPNEREAKKFARAKLVDTPNVSAGTLNPHLPKRTIASTQIVQWLLELDDLDAPA